MNKVSKAIMAKRSELNLTQQEIADKLGISQSLLGQYEKGKRNPKVDFYNKWHSIFGENINANVLGSEIHIDLTSGELIEMVIGLKAYVIVLEAQIVSWAQKMDDDPVELMMRLKRARAMQIDTISFELSRKSK